jgi:hypothetical protein
MGIAVEPRLDALMDCKAGCIVAQAFGLCPMCVCVCVPADAPCRVVQDDIRAAGRQGSGGPARVRGLGQA